MLYRIQKVLLQVREMWVQIQEGEEEQEGVRVQAEEGAEEGMQERDRLRLWL